ncbi:hypothetical protein DMENIID0001_114110 [Sergentomyia squamirostris]
MTLFGGSFGVLLFLQDLITLASNNFRRGRLSGWCWVEIVRVIPGMLVMVFAIADLMLVFLEDFTEYTDYNFVLFVVVHCDTICANLSIIALFIMSAYKTREHHRLLTMVEIFEENYPYKFKFDPGRRANFKFIGVLSLEVGTTLVFFMHDEEKYEPKVLI